MSDLPLFAYRLNHKAPASLEPPFSIPIVAINDTQALRFAREYLENFPSHQAAMMLKSGEMFVFHPTERQLCSTS